MIPLRCDIPQKRFPAATILVIAGCCITYVFQVRVPEFGQGFVPVRFMYALFHPGPGLLIALGNCASAFFLHAGIAHLASNMWFLWIFGQPVESETGFFRFSAAYILCGGISLICQALYSPLSTVPVVGASGAIAGIMGIHFILLPCSKILTWFPPIFIFRIPAFIFLIAWFLIQHFNAGGGSAQPVAWWAHIGGFLAGCVWGIIFRLGKRETAGRKRDSSHRR